MNRTLLFLRTNDFHLEFMMLESAELVSWHRSRTIHNKPETSITTRIPLCLAAVIFTMVMLVLFASDGLQYAVIGVVAAVILGFVLSHF